MAITRQTRLLLWRLFVLLAISGIVAATVLPGGVRLVVLWITFTIIVCTPAILGAFAIWTIVRSANQRELKRRAESPPDDGGG